MKMITTKIELFDYFKTVFNSTSRQLCEWYDGINIKWNYQDSDKTTLGYSGLDKLISYIGYDKNKLLNYKLISGIISIKSRNYAFNYELYYETHEVNMRYYSYIMKFMLSIRFYTIESPIISRYNYISSIKYPDDTHIYFVKSVDKLSYTHTIDDPTLYSINKDLAACISKLDSNKIIRVTGLGLKKDYKQILENFHESIKEINPNSIFYWGQSDIYTFELRWVILLNEYVLERINIKFNNIIQTIVPAWSFSINIITSPPK